jgi:integrase
MRQQGARDSETNSAENPTISRRQRGEGRIYRRNNSRFWWIQYYVSGRRVFESSHSDRESVAKHLLRQRLCEVAAGIAPPARAGRVTYEELRDALFADYAANSRKWLRKGKESNHYIGGVPELDKFFGGYRVANITTDSIRSFIRKRQEEGAANGTINRSLALLRRMYRLAVQDRKIRYVPHFPMLREALPRKGFLEYADFQKLRMELPEYLRPIATMGYYTGMRRGEILGLIWRNVRLLDGEIRLDPGNDEPRTVPLVRELLEMLRIEQQKNPVGEFVFMRDRERIGSFNKAWKSACKRSGLEGLLFHDLRRTGIRNLVRAGVPERVAMAISGHKTRAVFERYNIVSGRDLRDAVGKLETYLTERNSDSLATVNPTSASRGKFKSVVTN